MVGMAIGLLGILVMVETLSVSESQKLNTSGSDDAQNAGVIALYGLQRDIQLSGYGISSQQLLGCNVLINNGATLSNVGPVTINDASIPATAHDANTDTLLVVYGNGNGPEEGDGITAQPSPQPVTYTVQTQPSYTAGDYVVAQYEQRQTPCSLTLDKVFNVPASSVNVTVNTGVASIMTTNTLNGVTPTLFDLGQSPKVLVYAVQNGNLTVCDYMQNDCSSPVLATNPTVWVPIAGNIVSLKAQYGRDTSAPMDAIVDVYDQTTPLAASTSLACDWTRISAIRIALVARGNSSTAVTTTAPVWDGTTAVAAAAPLPGNVADPIDLSALSTWQNYRYRVFQTTVPIRNMTMKGAVTGC